MFHRIVVRKPPLLVSVVIDGGIYTMGRKDLQGKFIIYHAGSMTLPINKLSKEFKKLYPNVEIFTTASGSRKLAQQIVERRERVDLFVSADYKIIDSILIPDYSNWNVLFAKNSMAILYTDQSKYASDINANNWYDILLKNGVSYGYSQPNMDPCGYRTVLLWQLAENYYNQKGLYQKLLDACPEKNIRLKSAGLISLLETKALDYVFEYESVGCQNHLRSSVFKYIRLPNAINLSSVNYADFYKTAVVDLKNKISGEWTTKYGEPIVYGLTIPTTGESKEIAVAFLKFMLDEQGMKIIASSGQPILETIRVKGIENIPHELKQILK